MGLFKRATKVSADGYERKTLRGYVDKGPVAKALAEGWEIETMTPIQVGGNTFKQAMYLLRRKAV